MSPLVLSCQFCLKPLKLLKSQGCIEIYLDGLGLAQYCKLGNNQPVSAPRLAQLGEDQSAEQEVVGQTSSGPTTRVFKLLVRSAMLAVV